MKNKYFVLLFALYLLLNAFSIYNEVLLSSIFDILIPFISLALILTIVMNGTYTRTKYFKLNHIFIAFLIVGALFRIQHYKGASLLFLISSLGIITLYTIHFFRKKDKSIVDFLKLFWLISVQLGSFSKIHHLPYSFEEINILTPILFILLASFYILTNQRKNPNWIQE